jgi:hypothetical protein
VGVGETDDPGTDDADIGVDRFTGSHACKYKSTDRRPAVIIR